MEPTPLKTIVYRGGVVRFRIPRHWVEEYADEGGGTFYPPGPDTGTLRLNVMTFRGAPEKVVGPGKAERALSKQAERYGVPVVPLQPGMAFIYYDQPGEEEGQLLRLGFWEVAQMLPPTHLRMIVFTYTTLLRQWDEEAFVAERQLLHLEIRNAEFAPVLEVTPP